MALQLSTKQIYEQKLLPWASAGLLIFVSAFLWAPSRDGLQGVFLLAFFFPMVSILLLKKPNFNEYGGWMTMSALLYAGFSVISSLWGKPEDFTYFAFQWILLAVWLCGSSFIFVKTKINLQKYFFWFVVIGALIIAIMIMHYCYNLFFHIVHFNGRLFGLTVFRNPNEIGAMCGVILLFAVTLAFQSTNLKYIWLLYAFALIAFTGLVVSFSRGALLASIITTFAALIIIRPKLNVWLPPAMILITIIAFALRTTSLDIYYLSERVEGLSGRLELWKIVINHIKENLIFGIGMTKNTSIAVANTEFHHAHNAWLDIFYRTGIIGFLLILFHMSAIIHKISRDNCLLPLYLWFCFGCIWHLFDGGCFFREIGAKWFLYWIPAGLIAAAHTEHYLRQSNTISEIYNAHL